MTGCSFCSWWKWASTSVLSPVFQQLGSWCLHFTFRMIFNSAFIAWSKWISYGRGPSGSRRGSQTLSSHLALVESSVSIFFSAQILALVDLEVFRSQDLEFKFSFKIWFRHPGNPSLLSHHQGKMLLRVHLFKWTWFLPCFMQMVFLHQVSSLRFDLLVCFTFLLYLAPHSK